MSRCGDFYSWAGGASGVYTNHGASANLNITGSISIDMWVKFRQPCYDGNNAPIIWKGVWATRGYTIILNRNPGGMAGKNTLTFVKMGGTISSSTVDIVNGTLVHIAITWNSVTGDIIFYRNGVAVQTMNDAPAIIASGDNFYVGYTVTGNHFLGCVYSLNVYNRVLSLAEVNYNMTHPQNPIRRSLQLGVHQESWQGGVWKDISPNAYDGTPTGVVLSRANNICGRCTVI